MEPRQKPSGSSPRHWLRRNVQSLTDWAAERALRAAGDSLGRLERVIAELATLDSSETGIYFWPA